MNSPHDPFSARFDAIDIDPARTPSAAAIDHALALCAPAAAAPDSSSPGFFLIDDAGGRFEVDRDMGVVTVKDEALLTREPGAVHAVHLRVVEQSGLTYDLHMQLRLTGRVPQMVGAEDLAAIAGVDSELRQPSASPAPVFAATPAPAPVRAFAPAINWTRYGAALAAEGKPEMSRTRRAFISAALPHVTPALNDATLALSERLPPVGLPAPWSV
jgi:hypothetical protein